MTNRVILLIITLILALVSSGCNNHDEHDEHKSHAIHWGYTGAGAPAHWGTLQENFKMCSQGTMQTPINIIPTQNIKLSPLIFDYIASSTTIINNGHSLQINIAGGNILTFDGKDYELKQFHFHTPSENNIKSEQYPLEAHFVHQSYDGKIAVVALMFTQARENPALVKIWDKLPLQVTQEIPLALSVDEILKMMPRNKSYYHFIGSLTTPPCTEGVQWIVLKTPMTVSTQQIEKFFALFGHPNNRPIQATNSRVISE